MILLSAGGGETRGRAIAVSTEFYVLAPRAPDEDLSYLLPFLLSDGAQAVLAAAQEGGHHPRVPRASLLALRVPTSVVRAKRRLAADTWRALDALYDATGQYHESLRRGSAT